MTYAAYLRIYEPVAAFHEPDRSRWEVYAASTSRPRRRDSLAAEQAESLRRAIAAPQIVVPEQESEHAYVRRADGVIYICPWQTRLRCLLSYSRMLPSSSSGSSSSSSSSSSSGSGSAYPALPGVVPARDDHETLAALARLADERSPGSANRLHILASAWAVPLCWFVPFAAAERWLALGPDAKRPSAPQTASATRALLYTTPMSRARKRVARGLAALRGLPSGFAGAAWDPVRAETELGEVGRWLEDFHPYSLVELDYGGLVQLLSDDALSSDQSAAEIAAAIDGVARGEPELALAMYKRAHSRWRAFAAFEMAN